MKSNISKHDDKSIHKKPEKPDPVSFSNSDDEEVTFITKNSDSYNCKSHTDTNNLLPKMAIRENLKSSHHIEQFEKLFERYNIEFNDIIPGVKDNNQSVFDNMTDPEKIPQPRGVNSPLLGCKFNVKTIGKEGIETIAFHMKIEHNKEYHRIYSHQFFNANKKLPNIWENARSTNMKSNSIVYSCAQSNNRKLEYFQISKSEKV